MLVSLLFEFIYTSNILKFFIETRLYEQRRWQNCQTKLGTEIKQISDFTVKLMATNRNFILYNIY